MYSEKYESKETLGNLSSCPVSILVSVLTICIQNSDAVEGKKAKKP